MKQGSVETKSTTELVQDALEGAKELVKIEVELAKAEVRSEVKGVTAAAVAMGVAAASSLLTLTLLAVALVLALGGTPLAALLVAGAFLVLGAGAAAAGYKLLPTKPLDRTRRRIEKDVHQLKEHVA